MGVPFVDLRLVVGQHDLAVEPVLHEPASAHFDLGRHPLIAVVGLGAGVGAMPRHQLAVDHDVGSRRAEIGRRPRRRAVAAEELDLDGRRKLLIARHRLRVRRQHDAGVAHRPSGPARGLLADEAVLHAHLVVRERVLVEHMAEPAIEARPLVVAHFQQAVLDAERVVEVLAGVVPVIFGLQPSRLRPLKSGTQSCDAAGRERAA